MTRLLSFGISVLLGGAAFAGDTTIDESVTYTDQRFMIADTRGMDRRDDRDDRQDGREDCRQEEGVGHDKRDCKQDERRDDGDDD